MRIGILQAGYAPPDLVAQHGQYSDMFQNMLAGRGLAFETWNVVDGEFPETIARCEGWLVTGSRFSAYEDLPWIRKLEAFLRDCYAGGIPVVGICFGHQVLARALGGKVEKFPGGWGIGRDSYDFEGQKVCLNSWHQDQVTRIPADASITGSSKFCRYAMLSYGERAISIQAHPEFDDSFIEGLIEKRGVGTIPAAQLDQARSQLGQEIDSQQFAGLIAEFFLSARPSAERAA